MAIYKDKNGVGWLIESTDGGRFFATPDPASPRQYNVDGITTEAIDQDGRNEATVASAIEAFAARHTADIQLRVTAKRDSGGWVLLVLLVLAAMEHGKRR